MPAIDWLTTVMFLYFFGSGFVSGAAALSTALAIALTLLCRSFVSATLVTLVQNMLSHYTAITPDQQLVSLLIAYLVFFLVARIVVHILLRIVLPASGFGRLLYAVASVFINGFAYLYLLSYILSTSPVPVHSHLQGSFTFKILQFLQPLFGPVALIGF